jgi:hypothetical protein
MQGSINGIPKRMLDRRGVSMEIDEEEAGKQGSKRNEVE